MVVKINCIVCEKPLKIPSCTKSDDYDGQIYCHECKLLWNIKWESSVVKRYKLADKQPEAKQDIKIVYELVDTAQKALTQQENEEGETQ